MTELIYGGSASGKSEYAESLLADVTEGKYYIATMRPFGEEGVRRIERHRILRSGKGFETIECQRNLQNLRFKQRANGVLIECISNLLANEMFGEEELTDEEIISKITRGCLEISRQADKLVIVSNNVSEDGIKYSSETERYIRLLEDINIKLGDMADKVTEVVVGIAITVKE